MKTKQAKGTAITVVEIRSQKDGGTYYACYKGDMRKAFQSKAPSLLFVAGSDKKWHKIQGRAPQEYTEEERKGEPVTEKPSGIWKNKAACKKEDINIFFPAGSKEDKDKANRKAKKICEGCEVKEECLERALSKPERHGTWGGMTEKERSDFLKKQKAKSRITDLRERA